MAYKSEETHMLKSLRMSKALKEKAGWSINIPKFEMVCRPNINNGCLSWFRWDVLTGEVKGVQEWEREEH
jgi:hypothetical protein